MELSIGEMLVIAIAIIVLFGPDKLPKIARELGAGVRKMKGAMEDIKTEIMKETDNPVSEIKKEIERVKDSVKKMDNPLNPFQEDTFSKDSSLEDPQKATPAIKPSEDKDYQGPVSR